MLIHPPKLKDKTVTTRRRFLKGGFPSNIQSTDLDDNLLTFWGAAQNGDPARQFLYYFRILEYASFVYLDAHTRIQLRKELSRPNSLDDLSSLSERVVSILSAYKADDYTRFESLVRELVDPSILWLEIENNRDFYANITTFDGGFTIKPIISSAMKEEEYKPTAIINLTRVVRDIRNALSHGKEQKTTSVIQPTIHNFERLQPWVSIIRAAAGEVILYRSTL